MVEYRPFHNTDPPRLHQLWHACALGRSAAEGFSCDILELFTFSQPFFDPRGLIVAKDGDRVVGFVHAGFAPNRGQDDLNLCDGIISALMVHPGFRRRGIATELLRRAADYLQSRGSVTIEAGGGLDRNGFYVGIYGGLQPSGFSQEAAAWGPFFASCGFTPASTTLVLRRNLTTSRDPISTRIIRNRRLLNLVMTDRPTGQPWWWFIRFGHLDSLRFELQEKSSGLTVASGQIIGMDVFIPKWGLRSVGIRDVYVPEGNRRHGYGSSLVLEICRSLRDETVQQIEAHVDHTNSGAIELFSSSKFECEDRLVTYRRTLG